jgi:hypothetical protein
MSELGRTRDGRHGLNYAIYHDRYERTGDGWKFTERVYEVRYEDTTPLAGSPPLPLPKTSSAVVGVAVRGVGDLGPVACAGISRGW